MAAKGGSLTTIQKRQLESHESIIKSHVNAFFEVGTALAAIRDGELYVDIADDFETYCKVRWQFTSSRARQLIGSAAAVSNVQSVTMVTPGNERQARILASRGDA